MDSDIVQTTMSGKWGERRETEIKSHYSHITYKELSPDQIFKLYSLAWKHRIKLFPDHPMQCKS